MELPKSDERTKKYFEDIIAKTNAEYDIAIKARSKGYDITTEVEVKQAINLADRTEAIIGPPGVAKRFSELYKELNDRTKVIFTIFEEIVLGKLGNFPTNQKRVEQAIRTALVLMTEGVVVAPIDGIPEVKLSENPDGSKYVDVFYAGPIRAAGATAAAIPMLLAEKAQVLLGLGSYIPTDKEIARYKEEVKLYEKISPRQFRMTDDDVEYLVRNCKACINGTGTDDDVSVNKDIPRVITNRIRGGVMLVMSDSICLKAPKLIKYAKSLGLDWGWLSRFMSVKTDSKEEKKVPEIKPNKKYLEGAAAGRPIIAYPSKFGGFRLRYGRTRTTGLMAKAIHPVTMYLLEEFPAVGTQLKVERPGKATSITACDVIEPPVILTNNMDVVRLDSMQKLDYYKDNVKKILFLGDILTCLGDFRKSGHPLVPVGFCEEWWHKILIDKIKDTDSELKKIEYNNVDINTAIRISRELGIPLYPKYTAFYKQMSIEDITYLRDKLKLATRILDPAGEIQKLQMDYDSDLHKIFVKIIIPLTVQDDKIIINDMAKALVETFAVDLDVNINNDEDVLTNLSRMSGIEIKDKAGIFIGARMGRPEAAKPRKMAGSPHGLFPVSKLGGSTRSVNKAVDLKNQESKGLLGNNAITQVDIGLFRCEKCDDHTPYSYCFRCNQKTVKLYYCSSCHKSYDAQKVPQKCISCSGEKFLPYTKTNFDIGKFFNEAILRLNVTVPDMVKGVEGLISDTKVVEPLEKLILRARANIFAFKDGTVRADLLDCALSHFKPRELGLSVQRVKELGYSIDMNGNPIENDNQIIRIFPQDIVINDAVGDYFVKVSNFIDELLVKFYHQDSFYNAKTKEDLIGKLVLGLAPHTSAAVVSRIIGYTKARVIFAHPYHVCARRRNVDGDQDSIMLLMDALLNFSKHYLASRNGGLMDAPLVATLAIDPQEIDDEVHEMDTNSEYSLEVYQKAQSISDTNFDSMIPMSKFLGKVDQYECLNFTHDTRQFDEGPSQSMYTQVKDMSKKILMQIELQRKISCVDLQGALEMVLNTHLFPDLIGNSRSFARQSFRCTKCNESFRRYPLANKCYKCGNDKLILTISEGSVKKYLEIAKNIVYQNPVSDYTKERMKILENEINSTFNMDKENQKSIMDFF